MQLLLRRTLLPRISCNLFSLFLVPLQIATEARAEYMDLVNMLRSRRAQLSSSSSSSLAGGGGGHRGRLQPHRGIRYGGKIVVMHTCEMFHVFSNGSIIAFFKKINEYIIFVAFLRQISFRPNLTLAPVLAAALALALTGAEARVSRGRTSRSWTSS